MNEVSLSVSLLNHSYTHTHTHTHTLLNLVSLSPASSHKTLSSRIMYSMCEVSHALELVVIVSPLNPATPYLVNLHTTQENTLALLLWH